MIRWPVSCSVQVWMYSAANARTQDDQVQRRQPVEARELPLRDVAVDRHLHQVRLGQRAAGADDDRDEARAAPGASTAQVLQQPAHQPRVVGLSENVVCPAWILYQITRFTTRDLLTAHRSGAILLWPCHRTFCQAPSI